MFELFAKLFFAVFRKPLSDLGVWFHRLTDNIFKRSSENSEVDDLNSTKLGFGMEEFEGSVWLSKKTQPTPFKSSLGECGFHCD